MPEARLIATQSVGPIAPSGREDGKLFPEMNAEPRAAGEPRWIEHAVAQAHAEVLLYLRTFAGVALRPMRFSRAWASGELEAAGPLAFMASSAAIAGVATQLVQPLLGIQSNETLLRQVGLALAPYLFYSAVGLLCHALLRPIGARRRWSTSLALALYAGGAMPMVAQLLSLAAVAGYAHFGKVTVSGEAASVNSITLVAFLLVPLVWFFASLARALAGAHEVKGRRAAAVVLVPALLTTFAPGVIPIPVMHAHFDVVRGADGSEVHFNLTDR
jgi:hypothetical protein